MHLNLQKKGISTDTRILAQFCLLSTLDNSCYKKEDSQKMQLMQKQKGQVVQKSEQNLKL